MRSKFSEEIKCDHIANNAAEVWNIWVKDIKDLPVAELADTLRSKVMELYARRRKIGEKLQGHTMLPIVVRQLNVLSRQLGHSKVQEGGRDEAEVTEITTTHKVIRQVVNLKNQTCSCREWQVSGKSCPHALALIITTRNPNMEDFLHPYFSVYHLFMIGKQYMNSTSVQAAHHLFIVGSLLFITIIFFLTSSNPRCSFSNPGTFLGR